MPDTRRRAARLLTLCAALLTLATATPASAAPTAAPPSDRLAALLDELVAGGVTGVVATVDDGDGVQRYAAGVARRTADGPLRPGAAVRAGSITKTFVATVALQLEAEGRLRLSDPVSRWLPDALPAGDRTTLRQLLDHTSGLFNYTEDPGFLTDLGTHPRAYRSPWSLLQTALAHPRVFPPGQGWSYSNTNYVVLGLVLERVTGRTVGQLLQDRVIGPLGLTRTSFPGATWRLDGYRAHGYVPPSLTGAGYADVTYLNASWAWAAGALVSTVDDLRTFMTALLGGRLLPPAQLREMRTTVPVDPTYGYGLGLYTQRLPCGTVWGHDGAVPGYQTVAYTDGTGRRSVTMAWTTQPDATTGPLLQLAVGTAVCEMFGLPQAQGTASRLVG